MPRGGKRTGTPGKAYGNRTDLNQAAIAQFKGQQYGAATQQLQAQQAVPPGPPGASQSGPPVPEPTGPAPGSLGAFGRPSDRPGEPITNGLASGPGAGPEALGGMGGGPGDIDFREMAIYLPTLEYLASQPGASITTKNFVRRLRGAMPPILRGQGE